MQRFKGAKIQGAKCKGAKLTVMKNKVTSRQASKVTSSLLELLVAAKNMKEKWKILKKVVTYFV